MARQIIIPGHPDVASAHRVALLEQQVAALTEAVRLLATALEGTPLAPDGVDTAPMARRAHELLPPLTTARPH